MLLLPPNSDSLPLKLKAKKANPDSRRHQRPTTNTRKSRQRVARRKMQSNPVERRAAGRPQQSMGFPPPQLTQPLPCPRCDSTTTKFCYYNNYNLSQPRYFCKSCRRYWTHGGTLRNVPVGGGTRKMSSSKKSRTIPSSSSSSSSVSATATPQPTPASSASAVPNAEPEMDMNRKHREIAPLLSPNLELGTSLKLSGYEFTSSFDGMGFGLSGGVGGFPELGDSGGALVGPSSEYNAWQLSSAEPGLMADADCLGWPTLAISNPTPEHHAGNNLD